MSKIQKIFFKILLANSDNAISFNDVKKLLEHTGFSFRIKGSHHIYTKEGVDEIINIQPLSDGKAKAYQIKQIRNLLIKYKLTDYEKSL